MIGGNKAAEFQFYRDNIEFARDLTFFGHAVVAGEQNLPHGQTYGLLMVMFRYGLIGMLTVLTVVVMMAAAAFQILADEARLGWRRYLLFVGCFVSLAMYTKYPGIVPSMPAVCLAVVFSLQAARSNPLLQRKAR